MCVYCSRELNCFILHTSIKCPLKYKSRLKSPKNLAAPTTTEKKLTKCPLTLSSQSELKLTILVIINRRNDNFCCCCCNPSGPVLQSFVSPHHPTHYLPPKKLQKKLFRKVMFSERGMMGKIETQRASQLEHRRAGVSSNSQHKTYTNILFVVATFAGCCRLALQHTLQEKYQQKEKPQDFFSTIFPFFFFFVNL